MCMRSRMFMSVSLIFWRRVLNVSTAEHDEESSHFGVSALNFISNMWCWCHKTETFPQQLSSRRIDRENFIRAKTVANKTWRVDLDACIAGINWVEDFLNFNWTGSAGCCFMLVELNLLDNDDYEMRRWRWPSWVAVDNDREQKIISRCDGMWNERNQRNLFFASTLSFWQSTNLCLTSTSSQR